MCCDSCKYGGLLISCALFFLQLHTCIALTPMCSQTHIRTSYDEYITLIWNSWKYDVNITRIESRPVSTNDESKVFDFFVDFYGSLSDTNVDALLQELKGMTDKLLVLDEKEVSDVCVELWLVWKSAYLVHTISYYDMHSAYSSQSLNLFLGSMVPSAHIRFGSNSKPHPRCWYRFRSGSSRF